MTTITTNKATLLLVEVPEGQQQIRGERLCTYEDKMSLVPLNIEYLPEGNWSILGWSDEIKEEVAKQIVEEMPTKLKWYKAYKNYAKDNVVCIEALLSFHSLLTANNIVGRKLVLKKEI